MVSVDSARMVPAGARFLQLVLWSTQNFCPPTDSSCDMNPNFIANSFQRCNLICPFWFPYHHRTVMSYSCLFWEVCSSSQWTEQGNIHRVCSLPQASAGSRVERPLLSSSLPCISFSQMCEVSSEQSGRIIWAFPPTVQRAYKEETCLIHTASLHCNICWFQDWLTGHLSPIKYLKQLLCEFARCPQTRLVCFHWADTKRSRVLWISSLNIKAVTMEMAYSRGVWSTLSRFEG